MKYVTLVILLLVAIMPVASAQTTGSYFSRINYNPPNTCLDPGQEVVQFTHDYGIENLTIPWSWVIPGHGVGGVIKAFLDLEFNDGVKIRYLSTETQQTLHTTDITFGKWLSDRNGTNAYKLHFGLVQTGVSNSCTNLPEFQIANFITHQRPQETITETDPVFSASGAIVMPDTVMMPAGFLLITALGIAVAFIRTGNPVPSGVGTFIQVANFKLATDHANHADMGTMYLPIVMVIITAMLGLAWKTFLGWQELRQAKQLEAEA